MIMMITIQPKLLSRGHILVHVPMLIIIIHARDRATLHALDIHKIKITFTFFCCHLNNWPSHIATIKYVT